MSLFIIQTNKKGEKEKRTKLRKHRYILDSGVGGFDNLLLFCCYFHYSLQDPLLVDFAGGNFILPDGSFSEPPVIREILQFVSEK